MEKFKSGFVSIIGKTNAGKSTLLNKIIGEKVAIVSDKPQTTLTKIIGIKNSPNYQIVFIDTPGIHKSRNKLDESTEKVISDAKISADILLIVVDGSKKFTNEDFDFIKSFDKKSPKTILVFSKIDATKYEKLYPILNKMNELNNISEIIPVSSFEDKNVDVLVDLIVKYLPESEIKYFDDDSYTDKSIKFLASELIREKALFYLNEEIPHGVAVEIISFVEKKNAVVISANLICEKQSHKQIIIGKNGSMIKQIGTDARIDIEKLVGKSVHLDLYVKVVENWRDSAGKVKMFYEETN